jgi:hypothetical protein
MIATLRHRSSGGEGRQAYLGDPQCLSEFRSEWHLPRVPIKEAVYQNFAVFDQRPRPIRRVRSQNNPQL